MEIAKTARGFNFGSFKDINGVECSIQESSIATEVCLWLGVNDVNPQIMASDAKRLGLDVGEAKNGWCRLPVPKEVIFSNRMHLTRHQVETLVNTMQYWLENDRLPSDGLCIDPPVELDSSFYHEAADRCFVLENSVEEHLLKHPAVSQNPVIKEQVEGALERLAEVYQELGSRM
jgi:hypothetical protein